MLKICIALPLALLGEHVGLEAAGSSSVPLGPGGSWSWGRPIGVGAWFLLVVRQGVVRPLLLLRLWLLLSLLLLLLRLPLLLWLLLLLLWSLWWLWRQGRQRWRLWRQRRG